jgi:hypothetical protein
VRRRHASHITVVLSKAAHSGPSVCLRARAPCPLRVSCPGTDRAERAAQDAGVSVQCKLQVLALPCLPLVKTADYYPMSSGHPHHQTLQPLLSPSVCPPPPAPPPPPPPPPKLSPSSPWPKAPRYVYIYSSWRVSSMPGRAGIRGKMFFWCCKPLLHKIWICGGKNRSFRMEIAQFLNGVITACGNHFLTDYLECKPWRRCPLWRIYEHILFLCCGALACS